MIQPSVPLVLAAVEGGDEQAFGCGGASCSRGCCGSCGRRRRRANIEPPVAVVGGLGRLGDEQKVRAWVFTAARRRAIGWRRQAVRRPTGSLLVALQADRVARLPDTVDPAALALLAELAADRAEVVALRVLGGLEVAKVAPIAGKRPSAGAGRRGLRRLA
jgi:hypothetical protein